LLRALKWLFQKAESSEDCRYDWTS
jgi:hypothetical protein